jgi:GTP-binding protein
MDARRAFTTLDRQMLSWIAPLGKASHVLLTKSDKLGKQEAQAVLRKVQDEFTRAYAATTVQLFSGVAGLGVPAAQRMLLGWLK